MNQRNTVSIVKYQSIATSIAISITIGVATSIVISIAISIAMSIAKYQSIAILCNTMGSAYYP